MPANYGVGFDNNEDSLPSRPESEEGNPEDAIEWRDLGFGFLLAESGELLPEGQLDNCLFFLTSEQGRSTTDDEFQEVD
jgi:hypothetical protein